MTNRGQLAEAIVKAEEHVRRLPNDMPARHKHAAFIELGELRKKLEDFDREARELSGSRNNEAADNLARDYIAIADRLRALEGKRRVVADEDLLREQLDSAWARLGHDGREYVRALGRRRLPR